MITFVNDCGKFELEVTTFQMAILYVWNDRPTDEISLESIRLATQLPDTELRRTLWVCISLYALYCCVLYDCVLYDCVLYDCVLYVCVY